MSINQTITICREKSAVNGFTYFYSVAEFATLGDMKNAITKLDNTELGGRKIHIIEDRHSRRRRYGWHVWRELIDFLLLSSSSVLELQNNVRLM